MGDVVSFIKEKKQPVVVCSFCKNSYVVGENPVFQTRDGAHSICAICVRILAAQLKQRS